jgi:hypothetical protein
LLEIPCPPKVQQEKQVGGGPLLEDRKDRWLPG